MGTRNVRALRGFWGGKAWVGHLSSSQRGKQWAKERGLPRRENTETVC